MQTLDEFFLWAEGQQNLEHIRPDSTELALLLKDRRMQTLCAICGDPHTAYRTIHIAGSKGKGSTAYLSARAFSVHGYRTGCYLSPHVYDYRERIRLLSTSLSDADMRAIADELRHTLAEQVGDRSTPKRHGVLGELPPTTFEILTLYAFLIFRAARCQWVVIECGLGGRHDSTNVAQPAAAIITSIEREHTQYLGKSLRKIATQKAGIVKHATPLFLSAQKGRVKRRIARIARRRGARLLYVPDYIRRVAHSDGVYRVTLRYIHARDRERRLHITYPDRAFLPAHITNIIMAYIVVSYFVSAFSFARFHSIIPQSQLIGRYEKICATPTIYCDGAHTPLSLAASAHNFSSHFGNEGLCIFGCSNDKDSMRLLRALRGRFARYIFTAHSYSKAHSMTDPDILLGCATALRFPAGSCALLRGTSGDDIARTVRAYRRPTLVCGSFYLIAPFRDALRAPLESSGAEII